MNQNHYTTIGKYLVKRLKQIGVDHMFGVPGDYVLPFFDYLEESSIQVIGNCNELNAGYAADAYARLNGVGAVCVTYGVGGFSVLNAVVGAYAERVPLIVISGAPKSNEPKEHHLLHHTIGNTLFQDKIYEKVTLSATILNNKEQAPKRIDEAIGKCLTHKRPVYLEIPLNMMTLQCKQPESLEIDTTINTEQDTLNESISETLSMLESADNPAILAGIEPNRLDVADKLERLIDRSGYPFATTLLGKGVVPEKHKQFSGVYNGRMGSDVARKTIEGADLLLNLGALMTDMNLGIWTADLDKSKMVVANSDRVRVKHHHYDHVSLASFLDELSDRISSKKYSTLDIEYNEDNVRPERVEPEQDKKMTVEYFYKRIDSFLSKGDTIISDTGDSILYGSNLLLPEDAQYVGQAFYLSIGYSMPATLGAELASPENRTVVFVGDGAFQMTAQELSSILEHGFKPIIFLMNNSGYTIERALHDGEYNDIHNWNYHKLPEVFGGSAGEKVRTEGELEKSLELAEKETDRLVFIEVILDKMDYSHNLQKLGEFLGS